MGKIFYIMGKSSSGKDTIFKKVKEELPELKKIVLYTTRPIRKGEVDGSEYFFVNDIKLLEYIKEDKVVEQRSYNTVCGIWKYFTVDDGQIDLYNNNYIMIGTLESFKAMVSYYGKEFIEPIYIEVEDGIRLKRAVEREQIQIEPKYAEVCRRFLTDTKDFSEDNLKKSGINKKFINGELNSCVSEIILYIREKL